MTLRAVRSKEEAKQMLDTEARSTQSPFLRFSVYATQGGWVRVQARFQKPNQGIKTGFKRRRPPLGFDLAFDGVFDVLLPLSEASGRSSWIVSRLLRVLQRYRIAEFGTNFFQ